MPVRLRWVLLGTALLVALALAAEPLGLVPACRPVPANPQ